MLLLALFTLAASAEAAVVYPQVRQNLLMCVLRASLLQPDSLPSVCLCSLSVIVACMALTGAPSRRYCNAATRRHLRAVPISSQDKLGR
jgi:hypothetical protein